MVCRNAHIEQLEQRRYRLISDYVVAEPEIRARLHGLELDRSKIGAADCPYIPIHFVPREKPSAYDRLLRSRFFVCGERHAVYTLHLVGPFTVPCEVIYPPRPPAREGALRSDGRSPGRGGEAIASLPAR
jgi:hypothetical protein